LNAFDYFYGDVTIEEYLEKFCRNSRFSQFVYVNLKTQSLRFHLNCVSYYHLKNISALLLDSQFHYEQHQFLFDYSRNSHLLRSNLEILQKFFAQCHYCLPFIVLHSVQNISHHLVGLKTAELRAIFVSPPAVVHLNPIVNGCRQVHGFFRAETKSDFELLKARRCNLDGQKLNVSVNKVSYFEFFILWFNSF